MLSNVCSVLPTIVVSGAMIRFFIVVSPCSMGSVEGPHVVGIHSAST